MKKYLVHVSISASEWIEVDAMSENEALEKADIEANNTCWSHEWGSDYAICKEKD